MQSLTFQCTHTQCTMEFKQQCRLQFNQLQNVFALLTYIYFENWELIHNKKEGKKAAFSLSDTWNVFNIYTRNKGHSNGLQAFRLLNFNNAIEYRHLSELVYFVIQQANYLELNAWNTEMAFHINCITIWNISIRECSHSQGGNNEWDINGTTLYKVIHIEDAQFVWNTDVYIFLILNFKKMFVVEKREKKIKIFIFQLKAIFFVSLWHKSYAI